MCVCVCVYVYVCMYVCVCVSVCMHACIHLFIFLYESREAPIPVAAQSKACVYGRSLVGISGSNPAEAVGVLFLVSLCVVW